MLSRSILPPAPRRGASKLLETTQNLAGSGTHRAAITWYTPGGYDVVHIGRSRGGTHRAAITWYTSPDYEVVHSRPANDNRAPATPEERTRLKCRLTKGRHYSLTELRS